MHIYIYAYVCICIYICIYERAHAYITSEYFVKSFCTNRLGGPAKFPNSLAFRATAAPLLSSAPPVPRDLIKAPATFPAKISLLTGASHTPSPPSGRPRVRRILPEAGRNWSCMRPVPVCMYLCVIFLRAAYSA